MSWTLALGKVELILTTVLAKVNPGPVGVDETVSVTVPLNPACCETMIVVLLLVEGPARIPENVF